MGTYHSSRHAHHRHHHRREQSRSRRRSFVFPNSRSPQIGPTLCIISAAIGALALGAVYIITNETSGPLPMSALWLSSIPAGISCFLGLCSIMRRSDRGDAAKVFFGLVVAALLITFHVKEYRNTATEKPKPPIEKIAARAVATMNRQIEQSTQSVTNKTERKSPSFWLGKHADDGVSILVRSHPAESKKTAFFNRNSSHKVAYAELSIANHSTSPITIDSIVVEFKFNDGTTMPSISPAHLLSRSSVLGKKLIDKISKPITIADGTSEDELPICAHTEFDWTDVTNVIVRINGSNIAISGRMYSAEEKPANASAAIKDGSNNAVADEKKAEDWYEGL